MRFDELMNRLTLGFVICCWIVFAVVFLVRRRRNATAERKRDNKALFGIVIAVLGYTIVWSFRRTDALLIAGGGPILGILFSVAAMVAALSSVWLILSAVNRLGKQWAVAARVVEDHQLVTDGPYGIVRNPIYAGMFGMLVASGLAVSYWWALVLGAVVYWWGTRIRIGAEEKLLRETFGEKFDAYARRVPPLIPRLL